MIVSLWFWLSVCSSPLLFLLMLCIVMFYGELLTRFVEWVRPPKLR